MSKDKDKNTDSLQSVKVQHMNCYFSQISEVSANTDNPNAIADDLSNCYFTHNSESLLIITRGGNQFYLPLDQEISRVFPMIEGLLIEFFVKAESMLKEILYYQRNKGEIDIQEPETYAKHCYATITRHPLSPVKILGELQDKQTIPWHKSKQKITYLSPQIPIALSFNSELNRNAIHLLFANLQQVQMQYQKAYISTHTYSLKNLIEFPHFQVLTRILYQSNQYQTEVLNAVIIKSTRKNQVYIYALTAVKQVQIYQVNLYSSKKQSVKLIGKIPYVQCIGSLYLYNSNTMASKSKKTQNHIGQVYQKTNQSIQMDITNSQIEQLKDCALLVCYDPSNRNNPQICYYHRGQQIWKQYLQLNPQQNIIQTLQINKYGIINKNTNKILKIINPLITNPQHSILIYNMQITLQEDKQFSIFFDLYMRGQSLTNILIEMQQAKLNVLNSVHMLLEELKLYETMGQQRYPLGMIIMRAAQVLNRVDLIDYYIRNGIVEQSLPKPRQTVDAVHQSPFDIFQLINKIIGGKQLHKAPIYCIYSRTSFVLNFLNILTQGQQNLQIQPYNHPLHSSHSFIHHKQPHLRHNYPLYSKKVYHLAYYNTLKQQQKFKQAKLETKEQKAFVYLIRNNQNLSEMMTYPQSLRVVFYELLREMRRNLPFSLYEFIPKLGFSLIHREDLYKNIELYKIKKSIKPLYLQKPSFDEHIKTLVQSTTSQEYFLTSNASQMNKINNDLVFDEIDKLLSSSSEIKVRVKDLQSIPQHRWEAESQNVFLKFANRKVSVLVGQGAFNLGTSRSFITDIIKIPKINLSGSMPNQMKVTLDLKDDRQCLKQWPEFHSGMAAGLKLSRHVIPLSEDHLKTWIFYQKPDTPKRDHSGFLLSLGLLGYLKCFSPTDIYQYLKPNNQFTSVAIILGIAASNIGRSDDNLSKALVVHIPALLPPNIDLGIKINVQTSALIGIGLLHKGTCNRSMTEITLSQIGKKPCTDKCLDREGYSLAAGWALGMICLGMKDTKQSFRDLQLEERLIRFIEGGKMMQPPQSMMSVNFMNGNKCSSVKQGNNVNLHITAPAALLALSLMYLKSNNSELSQKITIPNSFSTIQQCNPNHILLKVIAKNMIMWDYIHNTKQYVTSQIPELIRFIFQNSLKHVHQQYYLVYNVSEIDYQTITSIYTSVTTGCIISMGLKYAGTGDQQAVNTIKWHIESLKSMKIIKCQFANDPQNKNCIDQYQLFALFGASVLALSLVMAGTCDIQCLRIIKGIRRKLQDFKVFHYGFNMALNMALGFIFLGYGNYTFNRENMSIASLLITIYPQFPNSSTDNKWHLQALRHFYVLALEQKIFHAVDVDTNKVISVSTEMHFNINDKIVKQNLNTPVLLQESRKLLHIRIKDEDYFDVDFSFANISTNPKAIYIKRKRFRDTSFRLLNPENVLSTDKIRDSVLDNLKNELRYTSLLSVKSSDKCDISYLFGQQKSVSSQLIINQGNRAEQLDLYYTMLKDDKLEMFEIYMNIRKQLIKFNNHTHRAMSIIYNNLGENLITILNFQRKCGNNQFAYFINDELTKVQKRIVSNSIIKQYFKNPYKVHLSNIGYQDLNVCKIPSAKQLYCVGEGSRKMRERGYGKEDIELFLFTTFPNCSFTLLSAILSTLW